MEFKSITGTIGDANSSVTTFKVVHNTPQTQTFTFNREVNLTGYKYYEYIRSNGYAYISPKQIIGDNVLITYKPITTNIITGVSGSTLIINGNQQINLPPLNRTIDIIYRA